MRSQPLLLLFLLVIVGCSRTDAPTSPSPGGQQAVEVQSQSGASSPYLWGLWDVEYDPVTGELQVIPLREASGTWNVTMFLQPPAGSPTGLGVQILDATHLLSDGRIDVRVTVNHPFPGPKLRGFDVRGVVMGNGSITDSYNADILYPGQNDLRLLNADGYTRWMNAPEFEVPGILGFTPGALGSKGFAPDATINGYKYFAELIEPDQSVYGYFASSLAYVANRGSMTPGTSISRDYYLQFPTSPLQVRFQYAIIAGWEKATSGGDNPSPLDFPQNANAFEPIGLSVVDSSTLYMESPTKKGGDINLRLNLVDWWAYWDEANLSDYISKIVISSDQIGLPGGDYMEFDFSGLAQCQTSAANAEGVDIFIPDVSPSGLEGQEILIAVEMNGYDYSNPFGVPNAAGSDPLTSYFRHTFDVSTEFNDPPVIVSGVDGETDVFITDIITYTVTATDEDTPTLMYEWTVRDPLTGDVLYGPVPGDGAGAWEADWGTVDTAGTVEIHCIVSDGENQVQADPLTVNVNDVLFHADLNDITTGDNAGWTTNEHQGITTWTGFVGSDNVLQGYGYKFGPFNAMYVLDSADILVSPQIGIPPAIDRAIAVVFHSYQFEYYPDLQVGFDGGNFKVTEAPALPTYDDPEMDILAGKNYDGWLFGTAIDNQKAFDSDQYTDELWASSYEIPPAFIGSNVYLGFAAATDYADTAENHGWLIDDVQVRALPVGGNGPPIAGGPVSGDSMVPMLSEYPGNCKVVGYDLEDDPLSFAWTVRLPGSGQIVWGPIMGPDTGEMLIDWTVVGAPGQYEVHVSIYDGHHPGVPAPPLAVTVQQPVFHADFSDTTTGDNAGWSAILETGATQWTTTVGSDGLLKGYGYKWGDFNTSYQASSQGIFLSPEIPIPPGITKASIYVRHDFQFLASLDGGNFKVTVAPLTPDFSTNEEKIDGGFGYDVEMNGTVLDGQDAFGIGMISTNGLVSRMDLTSSTFGHNVRLGVAVASGNVFYNMRGWLMDDVAVAVTP